MLFRSDTNCDPDLVDYPIAGNDDAIRSVRLILTAVVQAISKAKSEYDAKYSRSRGAEQTDPAAAAQPAAEVQPPAAEAAPAPAPAPAPAA